MKKIVTEEKIIERVKKLLAMAGDASSPNEALIAAKRARILMDKHQISKADLMKNEGSAFGESTGEAIHKTTRSYLKILACSAAHLNDCRSIISVSSSGVKFRFQGFIHDARVAKLTFDYMVSSCERCVKNADVHGRSQINFFRLGFSREVDHKVEQIVLERKKVKTVSGKELILSKMQLVESHFETLPKARHAKTRGADLSEQLAYEKGAAYGKALGLDPQVSKTKTDMVERS